MSVHKHQDLFSEIIELCRDFHRELLHELNYYRASVYKVEASQGINRKLDHLRALVDLLNCDEAADFFLDFEASKGNGNLALAPGECLLSWRVTTLLNNLDHAYNTISSNSQQVDLKKLNSNLSKRRKQIAAIYPVGSAKRELVMKL